MKTAMLTMTVEKFRGVFGAVALAVSKKSENIQTACVRVVDGDESLVVEAIDDHIAIQWREVCPSANALPTGEMLIPIAVIWRMLHLVRPAGSFGARSAYYHGELTVSLKVTGVFRLCSGPASVPLLTVPFEPYAREWVFPDLNNPLTVPAKLGHRSALTIAPALLARAAKAFDLACGIASTEPIVTMHVGSDVHNPVVMTCAEQPELRVCVMQATTTTPPMDACTALPPVAPKAPPPCDCMRHRTDGIYNERRSS